MNALGKLEKLFLAGEISEEEYRKRKDKYLEILLEMYVMGIITQEELQERLNQ